MRNKFGLRVKIISDKHGNLSYRPQVKRKWMWRTFCYVGGEIKYSRKYIFMSKSYTFSMVETFIDKNTEVIWER